MGARSFDLFNMLFLGNSSSSNGGGGGTTTGSGYEEAIYVLEVCIYQTCTHTSLYKYRPTELSDISLRSQN